MNCTVGGFESVSTTRYRQKKKVAAYKLLVHAPMRVTMSEYNGPAARVTSTLLLVTC